ncbi:unnamed protein product [Linum tenue]|uniref:Fe2OG dioxygenase domain-containing protein n=1 Tax=Linum tenue TaxID=586396 RepID=A0AAV0QD03_9ROSI|nr:unnamed protein product [Linum tenue]
MDSLTELAAVGGENLPAKYIHPDGINGGKDPFLLPFIDIPVIDVGHFTTPSTDTGKELEKLRAAMAKSLKLDESVFLRMIGEPVIMSARFNFYPPCPRPDQVLGLKPHSDGTVITFLLQDKEVEGLQVLKDGQWFRVPVIPDALVLNAGEHLEVSKL